MTATSSTASARVNTRFGPWMDQKKSQRVEDTPPAPCPTSKRYFGIACHSPEDDGLDPKTADLFFSWFLRFSPVFSPVRFAQYFKSEFCVVVLGLNRFLRLQAGDKAVSTSLGLSCCFNSCDAVSGTMIQQYSGVIQGVPMFS
jgi:hypothetical protein